MQNELKPCPFCGGKATITKMLYKELNSHQMVYVISCTNDKCLMEEVRTFSDHDLNRVCESWNRRVDNAE